MTKRMLIDATHPEETRVVVADGQRLQDFDYEVSAKQQLKGNIYLAKVVRVEPSLQAAFLEYGGNRHGFLAFSEIHPDYYQIPVADRQALHAAASAAQEDVVADVEGDLEEVGETTKDEATKEDGEQVADNGGDDVEDLARKRSQLLRKYKIQEVIKRRQIMLVQVVKEERGNKGAALTTYITLAGRYCVVMPNTPRGGGISRKITDSKDRQRLKGIVQELDLPPGMGLIIRTAAIERSKAEIKRDFEYLLRLWDDIRERTLQSVAPTLIHEEGDLVKRAIRDLYDRDIEEVLVEGDEGYRATKHYMKMLMPSHARRVKPYKDRIPLFYRYQVESQLDAMHSPIVQLKSGGYLVVHVTEALVAIDVNSGRATKERHIEETALKTNLEAADEVARQLRLRDLAGLIVIDFIDMEEPKNQRAVERRLRDALKVDRARLQVGKISPFGLLELSRQRLRPSLLETSTEPCATCGGTGTIRSPASAALHVLRAIEEEGIRERSAEASFTVPTPVALYLLNQKRAALAAIEERYRFQVTIAVDDHLVPGNYRMDRVRSRSVEPTEKAEPQEERKEALMEGAPEEEDETAAVAPAGAAPEKEGDGGSRKRRRRRRRKKRPEEAQQAAELAEATGDAQETEEVAEGEDVLAAEAALDEPAEAGEWQEEQIADAALDEEAADAVVGTEGEQELAAQRPKRPSRRRGRRSRGRATEGAEMATAPGEEEVAGPVGLTEEEEAAAEIATSPAGDMTASEAEFVTSEPSATAVFEETIVVSAAVVEVSEFAVSEEDQPVEVSDAAGGAAQGAATDEPAGFAEDTLRTTGEADVPAPAEVPEAFEHEPSEAVAAHEEAEREPAEAFAHEEQEAHDTREGEETREERVEATVEAAPRQEDTGERKQRRGWWDRFA